MKPKVSLPSTPFDPILNQLSLVHAFPSGCLGFTLILFSYVSLGLSSRFGLKAYNITEQKHLELNIVQNVRHLTPEIRPLRCLETLGNKYSGAEDSRRIKISAALLQKFENSPKCFRITSTDQNPKGL